MYRFAERIIYPTRADNVMHEEAASSDARARSAPSSCWCWRRCSTPPCWAALPMRPMPTPSAQAIVLLYAAFLGARAVARPGRAAAHRRRPGPHAALGHARRWSSCGRCRPSPSSWPATPTAGAILRRSGCRPCCRRCSRSMPCGRACPRCTPPFAPARRARCLPAPSPSSRWRPLVTATRAALPDPARDARLAEAGKAQEEQRAREQQAALDRQEAAVRKPRPGLAAGGLPHLSVEHGLRRAGAGRHPPGEEPAGRRGRCCCSRAASPICASSRTSTSRPRRSFARPMAPPSPPPRARSPRRARTISSPPSTSNCSCPTSSGWSPTAATSASRSACSRPTCAPSPIPTA